MIMRFFMKLAGMLFCVFACAMMAFCVIKAHEYGTSLERLRWMADAIFLALMCQVLWPSE